MILLEYFININKLFYQTIMLLKYHTNLKVKVLAIFFSNMQTVLPALTSHLSLHNIGCYVIWPPPDLTLSAPHAIYKKI